MTQPLVTDISSYARLSKDGRYVVQLAVGGMHCAGCAFKIEKALNTDDHVHARVNVTEKRLTLSWDGIPSEGNVLAARVRALGFDLSPIASNESGAPNETKALMRNMAIAGFAAGNIMVFSLALWFTPADEVSAATRQLFHWFSALLALPAVVYAGRPFFSSAWRAVSHGRGNMDVPIAVALILASALSLQQTIVHGSYVYFDSVTMLLFFLLVGRYLDARVRAHTRNAAADMLQLVQGEATVVAGDGGLSRLPASSLVAGMQVIVAKGEKVLADGIIQADTLMDTCALTGESVPRVVKAQDTVYAGMINLGEAVYVLISKPQSDSLMSDIAALMEKATQGNARYVRLADRVSAWYTPVVHLLALMTFGYWWQVAGISWQQSLMYAATVLIITCPCALALAIPVSQVVAVSALFRKGLLVKSADAFERMATIDTVIFDKTGTLTTGELLLQSQVSMSDKQKTAFAALAAHSSHPLSYAVFSAFKDKGTQATITHVHEHPGLGIEGTVDGQQIRLGNAAFVGQQEANDDQVVPVVYCRYGQEAAHRLIFGDHVHEDAKQSVSLLKKYFRVVMLTGDRAPAANAVAAKLGIDIVKAEVNPQHKHDVIEEEKSQGYRVLMVGDGLNDAAALCAATASLSPSSAVGIAQNAADMVYQRSGVMPVVEAVLVSRCVQKIIKQNFYMALLYNVIAVPLAVAGVVTPLIAAASMSLSSLMVTVNALRLRKGGVWMF